MNREKVNLLKYLDDHLEEFISVLVLLAMTVVVGMQVFMRYVVGSSLSWSEELLRFMFIWLSYITVAYCVKKKRHARLEVLVNKLPAKFQQILEVFTLLAFLVFALAMLYYGTNVMLRILGNNQLSPALEIPMWYVYLSIPAGFALCIFRIVQQVFLCICNLSQNQRNNQGR